MVKAFFQFIVLFTLLITGCATGPQLLTLPPSQSGGQTGSGPALGLKVKCPQYLAFRAGGTFQYEARQLIQETFQGAQDQHYKRPDPGVRTGAISDIEVYEVRVTAVGRGTVTCFSKMRCTLRGLNNEVLISNTFDHTSQSTFDGTNPPEAVRDTFNEIAKQYLDSIAGRVPVGPEEKEGIARIDFMMKLMDKNQNVLAVIKGSADKPEEMNKAATTMVRRLQQDLGSMSVSPVIALVPFTIGSGEEYASLVSQFRSYIRSEIAAAKLGHIEEVAIVNQDNRAMFDLIVGGSVLVIEK